jgi:hypothetical protein
MNWPSRSPNMSSIDFYLGYGFFESMDYNKRWTYNSLLITIEYLIIRNTMIN